MAGITGGEQSLYAFEGVDIARINNDQAKQGCYALKIGHKDIVRLLLNI